MRESLKARARKGAGVLFRAGERLDGMKDGASDLYLRMYPLTGRVLFGSYAAKCQGRPDAVSSVGRGARRRRTTVGKWRQTAALVVLCSALAFVAGASMGFMAGLVAGPPLMKRLTDGSPVPQLPTIGIPEDRQGRPEEAR